MSRPHWRPCLRGRLILRITSLASQQSIASRPHPLVVGHAAFTKHPTSQFNKRKSPSKKTAEPAGPVLGGRSSASVVGVSPYTKHSGSFPVSRLPGPRHWYQGDFNF